MKISIFGLGYVGTVTAACLSRDGHGVTGVDVNPDKVGMVMRGESPIVEPGLEQLMADAIAGKRLTATTDASAAVAATEVSLICVGTPATEKGGPDLGHVFKVCEQIAGGVAKKKEKHVVILRSTAPPGTLDRCAEIFARHCDRALVSLASNPEFLREGTAIQDFDAPPFTVIGTDDALAEKTVRGIYASVKAPVFMLKPREAEFVKYLCNPWHAVKVTFANEIGRLSRKMGIDARRVMDVFLQDNKLNLSKTYMRPGFAYGGSCLPKDMSGLLHMAQDQGVQLPMLHAVPSSNHLQVECAVAQVLQLRAKRVTVLGLAFKANTDDLRESPVVPFVKRLLGEGCEVTLFDPAVNQARLMGTNLNYIRENLPHFERLMTDDASRALDGADLVVVTQSTDEFRRIVEVNRSRVKRLYDLANAFQKPPEGVEYYGIAW